MEPIPPNNCDWHVCHVDSFTWMKLRIYFAVVPLLSISRGATPFHCCGYYRLLSTTCSLVLLLRHYLWLANLLPHWIPTMRKQSYWISFAFTNGRLLYIHLNGLSDKSSCILKTFGSKIRRFLTLYTISHFFLFVLFSFASTLDNDGTWRIKTNKKTRNSN
jgi:hypothetical protein